MTEYTNIGLYSPKQAERLIGVDADKIRRWLMPGRSSQGPLWAPEPQALGAEDTLSFRDLLELRAVAQFRRHNVSMRVIREALDNLSEYYKRGYPLINPHICTDGEKIFLQLLEHNGELALTDLGKHQNVFRDIIAPSLIDGIEFDAQDHPVRWHPDPNDTSIVIDPRFAFGKPIVLPSYMATATLAHAAEIEQSLEAVASQHDISRDEVERAVKFEKRMSTGALLH